MKYSIFTAVGAVLLMIIAGCSQNSSNPLLQEFNTPFQTPPFRKIKVKHYMPAFKEAINQHNEEIETIAENKEEPSFKNTIVALDNSGILLSKVGGIFYNLLAANTSDELQKVAEEVSPLLSKHSDDVMLNKKLFKRIKSVYEKREKLNLSTEDRTLLKKTYKNFVRGGANLNEEEKTRLREINKKLSLLSLKFGNNILKENNRFELVIDKKEDLSGLPQTVIDAAAHAAKEKGYEGKWLFTLDKPSLIPFLQYSDKRNLREKMFKGYITKGDHNDELDNKKIVKEIVDLRLERANLLGYTTHADYVLEENMAKNPANVYKLLDKIWKPALAKAKKEEIMLQKMAGKDGNHFTLQPWDWWYYAEKLKKDKYDLDESKLKPYFQLENVRKEAFKVAHNLYGISFVERNDIPVYNDDVKVFEVKDKDGSHIGILYTDYFFRKSKRGGAWMDAYRKQYRINSKNVTPVICNVCNFAKPTKDTPSLLSYEDAQTLFHEFGHALHGLLSNCTYRTLSGTSVAQDFVELPSQFMENFAREPSIMKEYAKHYKTGKVIPDKLIKKIKKTGTFNQGFATTEYLAASYLDMDWHTITKPVTIGVNEFEKASMDRIGLIPQIVVRYRSTYFSHIFSGGYSAGYYSYVWAEVLDADAFEAFKEAGLFDQKTAKKFRDNVLSRGGTEDAMVLYKRFRGAEPKIDALLERRGLK